MVCAAGREGVDIAFSHFTTNYMFYLTMVSGAKVGMSPAALNILWMEIKTEKNSVVQFKAGPAALGSVLDNHFLCLVLDAFVYLLDIAALATFIIVNPYPATTGLTIMNGGPRVGGSRIAGGER